MANNQHNYSSGRINRYGAEGPEPGAPEQGTPQEAGQPPPRQQPPPQAAQPYRQSISRLSGVQNGILGTQGEPPILDTRTPEAQSAGNNARQNVPQSGRAMKRQKPAKQPRQPSQPGQPRRQAAYMANGGAAVREKRRFGKGAKIILAAVLAFLLLAAIGFLAYLNGFFDTGVFGAISKNYIPKDYKKSDVVNILIVGIDYEEGREYENGLGMTDMILYLNYDLKNNQMDLLQIPRDSYVGEQVPTGGTGKINAALISGEDKKNPINNLVSVVEQQYRLPVDHYIAMDMDALKTIVDTFGGLRVYVPREMSHDGSYLPQGWQWLDGNACEFFVRNRSGEGFERADIDRLDNQRHFYSALFRRFLNLTPTDIVHLLPVFEHYCNTDIGLKDIFDLCFSALSLKSENVMFCKVPGATGKELDPTGAGRDMYIVDKYGRGTEADPGTAALLNQYFRSGGEVAVSELGLPDVTIPADWLLYSPNVQVMTSVQEGEGGADVDVEPSFG